jgi:hypothetical protein
MPPTTAELVHDRSPGDLLIHRDFAIRAFGVPSAAQRLKDVVGCHANIPRKPSAATSSTWSMSS